MDNTSASRTRTAQELLKLQDEEMRLQQMRDDLQEQVTTLTERVQLLTEFARGSFAPLAFTSGQELISGLMPMSENEQKLTAYLKQLVIAAEKVVRQRSPEMPADAPPLLFVGGSETRYVRLDAEEAVTSLARRIHGLGREMPIIIRLAPVNNVPVNGPALISVQTVELIPNATIYVAGEEIARVEVTSGGALTSAQALGLLVDDLLRVHVPEALRARGVPMITRRFDLRTPEQVPEASVSRVPWSELLAVAEQAAAHQGSIAIVAKAKTPITCYGPVDLTFAVLAREK
ncbi:MAG: hypothetical protein BWY76_02949 [bacterium ADurb.Bin429]|nr:MAG: hypothetical protein BWY76_02949 [bacterium ADurb.Bin429]